MLTDIREMPSPRPFELQPVHDFVVRERFTRAVRIHLLLCGQVRVGPRPTDQPVKDQVAVLRILDEGLDRPKLNVYRRSERRSPSASIRL